MFYKLSVYARKINIAGKKLCFLNSLLYLPREVQVACLSANAEADEPAKRHRKQQRLRK